MNKYFFLSLILTFIVLLTFSSGTAFAHFEETDKTITVTLHVDPNDTPIPGEQAALYFLFADTTERFKLAKCICILTVSEQKKQIFRQVLIERNESHPSVWGTNIPFVFPHRDMYYVTLRGKPITLNAFQPFNITWGFRVNQYPKKNLTDDIQSSLFYFGIVLGIFILTGTLVFFGMFILDNVKNKKR